MADKAQTWVYTEDYVAESDALTAARAVASELGASPVSSGTGAALRMLAAVAGARAVLEVGTGAGVSGLWLLDGMAPDGVLTTIDVESELLGHARRNFAAAGLSSHRTRLIAGRALDVLPRMAARGYDMVVLDGDLDETPQYLDHAVRILRPGGTIAFVHALWHDQVADPARRDARTVVAREVVNYLRDSEEFVPALLPVGDGLAVAVRPGLSHRRYVALDRRRQNLSQVLGFLRAHFDNEAAAPFGGDPHDNAATFRGRFEGTIPRARFHRCHVEDSSQSSTAATCGGTPINLTGKPRTFLDRSPSITPTK